MQITGVPWAARRVPRWKSGPVDSPPYSCPSSRSVHTWPERSIENAWVTDTMRSCRAISAGSQTCSMVRSENRSSESSRS